MGFVVRPIGAAAFGHLGDRVGRRKALVVSVGLMGACTTAIGVLPTCQTWGTLTTVLLAVLRLLGVIWSMTETAREPLR